MEPNFYTETATVLNADADFRSLLKPSALLRYVEQVSADHARAFGMDDKFFRESGNYLPHTYPRNSVVYTGTHDNVTTEGWRTNASPEDVAYACRYLRCKPEDLTESMICACLASVSDMAIIPLADWLHLGSEARINTPSTQGANWQWRLAQPLPDGLDGHIAELTRLYDRAPA